MRKHLLGRSESKQQRKVKKKKRLERKTKGKKVARKRSDLFGFVKMLDVILLKFNILFFKINYSCKIFFWVVIYKFLYSQSFLFLQTFSFSKKELYRKCFLLNLRYFFRYVFLGNTCQWLLLYLLGSVLIRRFVGVTHFMPLVFFCILPENVWKAKGLQKDTSGTNLVKIQGCGKKWKTS